MQPFWVKLKYINVLWSDIVRSLMIYWQIQEMQGLEFIPSAELGFVSCLWESWILSVVQEVLIKAEKNPQNKQNWHHRESRKHFKAAKSVLAIAKTFVVQHYSLEYCAKIKKSLTEAFVMCRRMCFKLQVTGNTR